MDDRVFIQEETLEIQWKCVNMKKMNTLSPELLGNFNKTKNPHLQLVSLKWRVMTLV